MWIWAAIFSVVIAVLGYTFISNKDSKSSKSKGQNKVTEKPITKTNGKSAPTKKGKQESRSVAQPAKVEPKSEPKPVEATTPTKSKKNKSKAQKPEPVIEAEPEIVSEVVPEAVEPEADAGSPKKVKAKKNKKKSSANKSKNQAQADQDSAEGENEHNENGNVLDDSTFVTPQKVASTKFDRSNVKGAKVSKPVESTNPWALLGEETG